MPSRRRLDWPARRLNSATSYLMRRQLVDYLAGESRYKRELADEYPDLNPDFIFACPGYNVRSTEINAVIGRSQLPRLDACIRRRQDNLQMFLDHLDPTAYRTDFAVEGNSNYAFTLILRQPDDRLMGRVTAALRAAGVEFRRGTAGADCWADASGDSIAPHQAADTPRNPRRDHVSPVR